MLEKADDISLILGFGQIGKAIGKCIDKNGFNFSYKDIDKSTAIHTKRYDTLHVCLPFKDEDSFTNAILDCIDEHQCETILIHSTIPPATTNHVKQMIKNKKALVAHCPIRGVHPNLDEGIRTFPMLVGIDNAQNYEKGEIQCHLRHVLGVVTVVFCHSIESELAKLLDTTYYGFCIAFAKETKSLCDMLKADYNTVYTIYNNGYNEGYEKLGKKNVRRPVLEPVEGKIGGHCVAPNAILLMEYITGISIMMRDEKQPKDIPMFKFLEAFLERVIHYQNNL